MVIDALTRMRIAYVVDAGNFAKVVFVVGIRLPELQQSLSEHVVVLRLWLCRVFGFDVTNGAAAPRLSWQ